MMHGHHPQHLTPSEWAALPRGTWPFEPHRKPEAISRCWTCVAFRRG